MHTISVKVPTSPLTEEDSEFLLDIQARYFEAILNKEKDLEQGLISEAESNYVSVFSYSELSRVSDCFKKILDSKTSGFCKLSENQLKTLRQSMNMLKDFEAKAKMRGGFCESKKVQVSTFFEIMIEIAVCAI